MCPWTVATSSKFALRFDLLFAVMNDQASYVCDACGEEIVIPIDVSQGPSQDFVEDCPVCCRANVIHLEIDEEGDARAWAEME